METGDLLESSAAKLSELHSEFLEGYAKYDRTSFDLGAFPWGVFDRPIGSLASRSLHHGGSHIGLARLQPPGDSSHIYFSVLAASVPAEKINAAHREAAECFVELSKRTGAFLPTALHHEIAEGHRWLPDDTWHPPFLAPQDVWLNFMLQNWNEVHGPEAGWSYQSPNGSISPEDQYPVLRIGSPFLISGRAIERLLARPIDPNAGSNPASAAESANDLMMRMLIDKPEASGWSAQQWADALGFKSKSTIANTRTWEALKVTKAEAKMRQLSRPR